MRKSKDELYKKRLVTLCDKTLELVVLDLPLMSITQRLKLFETLNAYRLPKLKTIELSSKADGLNEEQANEFLIEYLKKIENGN